MSAVNYTPGKVVLVLSSTSVLSTLVYSPTCFNSNNQLMIASASAKIKDLATDWQDPQPEKPPREPFILPLIRFGFRWISPLFPRLAARVAYRFFTTPRQRARHKKSEPVLEQARVFEFLTGRRMLKGYEWGQGDRVVLLVHGWESRGTAMRTFVPPLLNAGFRVVAFDGPAHGDSRGRATTMPEFAAAVRAIMNQFGDVEHIITHSFGGPSTMFALRHLDPQRHLKKLVMVAAPNRAQAVFDRATTMLGVRGRTKAIFRQMLERTAGLPLHAADVSGTLPPPNIDEILLIHDREDAIVPFSDALETANNWPDAQLLTTNGYGHYRLMKNPDLIRYVADFLTER